MLNAYISGTNRDTDLFKHSYERYNDSLHVSHQEKVSKSYGDVTMTSRSYVTF